MLLHGRLDHKSVVSSPVCCMGGCLVASASAATVLSFFHCLINQIKVSMVEAEG